MLSVRNVEKSFQADRPVLTDFSLDVQEGDFVSLIGPSGCGKTTLLRIVAGLLSPSAGEVYVGGKLSLGPSPDKGVVFQHFNLFPWRTALSNVAYGLEIQGVPKEQRNERARSYLRLMGLQDSEQLYPSEISGGMRQRVGIARALAIEPKVLLMDEPFGALDALTREYLQGELQKICYERKLSVLFVTHSIDEAIYLSDRIIVMGTNPGRIIETFEVPLRRPRWEYAIQEEPAYGHLRSSIWSILEKELAGHVDRGSRRQALAE